MTDANTIIYHIAEPSAVKTAKESGHYKHPSLDTEGFIHCCLKAQMTGVIERYYADTSGLELLTIDPAKLKPGIVFENTVGGQELFPHIYGEINMDAVLESGLLEDSLR